MKRLHKAIPLLIWALVLLPFFLGAPAAHPVKDDFTFALYTHPTWLATGSLLHVIKDAVSYALRTWRDWQGTFTGVVIMALNPAVFSIEHYGWHAVILLLGHLAAWFVFMRHMLCRRMGLDKGFASAAYLALSACMLVYLPDFLEGVYWFNGAWFYTGAQAVSLVTLVLCDRMSVSGAGRGRLCLHALACCGLLFALGSMGITPSWWAISWTARSRRTSRRSATSSPCWRPRARATTSSCRRGPCIPSPADPPSTTIRQRGPTRPSRSTSAWAACAPARRNKQTYIAGQRGFAAPAHSEGSGAYGL